MNECSIDGKSVNLYTKIHLIIYLSMEYDNNKYFNIKVWLIFKRITNQIKWELFVVWNKLTVILRIQ